MILSVYLQTKINEGLSVYMQMKINECLIGYHLTLSNFEISRDVTSGRLREYS